VTGAPLLPPGFLARLAALEPATGRTSGLRPGGIHAARRAGTGTLFRDHRAYVEGDDLRFVDWSVFARHGQIATKQFEGEEAVRVVLLLDASASMAAGGADRLRAAARGLALLGAVALARGDTVDLLAVPGGRRRTFRGRARVPDLLEALAAVEAGGTTDLAAAFRAGLSGIRGRPLAAVASDFLDPRGALSGVAALLRRGWEVVALHPVAPADLAPPPEGPLLLVDAETGEERALDLSPAARLRLAAAAGRRLESVRSGFRARGVAWIRLPVGEGTEGEALGALRRARVLA
jgi:uncharacterized protein (DUF58 family)